MCAGHGERANMTIENQLNQQRGVQKSDFGGFFAFHGIWAPGVRLFRNLGFGMKAVIISLAFIVPGTLLQIWLLYNTADASMQSHKDSVRQHVEIAYGVLDWAHEQERAGKLTTEQAQQTAQRLIGAMRYDKVEYFWINDMAPRMVMHPTKPELNGKELGAMKDPNGFALFDAFVKKVRSDGHGFVAYQWPRPGADKPVDKVSYVKGFEPWGWVIGSGVYVDDVREAFMKVATVVASVLGVAMAIAGYFFLSFYRVINGGLNETRRHLRAMTKGDLTTSPSPWGRDEAASLMRDLGSMQEFLRSIVHKVRRSSDEIVHSSSEVASGASDLSARTEQAAANLEESSAALEQISATVKSTAELTQQASKVARQNAEVAADGGNVMRKVVPDAPHEVLLVLDASTGQNAIEQARQFTAATEVTALALTKLDGTAKGGVAIGISHQFQIPIRYLGVGEGIEDLMPFERTAFVEALFKGN